jgi:manganese efflux pump family protein
VTGLEILIIAVALAMDAFAVSVAAGVTLRTVSARQTFRLAWHFGLFQALMPILGWVAGLTIQRWIEAFDHWAAFGLLSLIGVKLIVESVRGDGGERKDTEPTRGMTMVMLSVATSIDALAVGLSLALLRVSVWFPALVIGVVACVFTAVGLHLGGYVGRRFPLSRYAGVVGGVVLIGIGVRVLHEHGVF